MSESKTNEQAPAPSFHQEERSFDGSDSGSSVEMDSSYYSAPPQMPALPTASSPTTVSGTAGSGYGSMGMGNNSNITLTVINNIKQEIQALLDSGLYSESDEVVVELRRDLFVAERKLVSVEIAGENQ